MQNKRVAAYTDGSCHTQLKTGAWASIIFFDNEKKILVGMEQNTTHHRMELKACIATIEWLTIEKPEYSEIQIYTDSQYVVSLVTRKDRLKSASFTTKNGRPNQNTDLVKELILLIEKYPVKLLKVIAHQKISEIENPNIEVDKMVRKLLRKNLSNSEFKK